MRISILHGFRGSFWSATSQICTHFSRDHPILFQNQKVTSQYLGKCKYWKTGQVLSSHLSHISPQAKNKESKSCRVFHQCQLSKSRCVTRVPRLCLMVFPANLVRVNKGDVLNGKMYHSLQPEGGLFHTGLAHSPFLLKATHKGF